jgi:hypothetical protein
MVRASAGHALPAGLSLSLVPEALRPSALYPAQSASVDDAGTFKLYSEQGRQTLVVAGLPAAWGILSVNGAPGRDTVDVSGSPAGTIEVLVGPSSR